MFVRANIALVQRILKVHTNMEAADEADLRYYADLSADERLDLQLTLIAQYQETSGETASRFERVCRVTKLSQG